MLGLKPGLAVLLLTVVLLQLFHIRVAEAQADSTCGYLNITVSHSRQAELTMTCQALADVAAYFRDIDLWFEPNVSLMFSEKATEVSGQAPVGRSHGFFDERESTIVMMRSSGSHPWGLRWNSELAASFLRHELVHMAVRLILGDDQKKLRPEWHEFIAYSVQLELMSQSLRASILAKHSDVMAFASLSGINEFTYRMDPAIFSIASFKTYRENGSKQLVRRLLRFELQPPPMSYPFTVLPGQIPE